eukprot:7245633-Alexandrium_andersonii.AAC.1
MTPRGALHFRNSRSPCLQRVLLWADIAREVALAQGPLYLAPDFIFSATAVLAAAGYRSADTVLSGAKFAHIERGDPRTDASAQAQRGASRASRRGALLALKQ